MKTEIITKLEKLLETDNIFTVQQEFKQLAAQFRNLIEHGVSNTDESEEEQDDDEQDDDSSAEVKSVVANDAKTDTPAAILANTSDTPPAPVDEKTPDSDETKEVDQTTLEISDENLSEEIKPESESTDESAKIEDSVSESTSAAESIETDHKEEVEESEVAEVATIPDEESTATLADTGDAIIASVDEKTPEQDEVMEVDQAEAKISDENVSEQIKSESESTDESAKIEDFVSESTSAAESIETDNKEEVEEGESADVATITSEDSSTTTPIDVQPEGNESESFDEAKKHFEAVVNKFKVRLENARIEKKKIEADTLSTAKDLLEELQKLVENEENIGKAFNGFNAIQDKWKSLPRVSNDSYRDLNIEYNKFAEQFFYNINIYKELKELDLKHNLEQKFIVIEDQRKLSEINDIRRMEVEVRLNQDRWNEIGPTFKEEWNVIKDEFWNITKVIYKKIQDFYNERREQQQKNFEQKEVLLNKLNQILTSDLQSNKKWQAKTAEVIDLQKQWKMVGYVPKEKAKIWKEFRKGCDKFFENKRLFLKEITDVQDANRDAKQKLLDIAESIKDSDNFTETSHQLINLQKEWKEIGSASQRDENRLWRKFRQACDTFFQKRKGQKEVEVTEQKANLVAKHELLQELEKFEPGSNPGENITTLKEFAEKWRAIGHVPFKEKDEINKVYKKLLDGKFGTLKIDKKQKEKIRFEQKLEDIRDRDNNDYLIQKEQDAIRAKISKLKNEVIQFENNMGFFASSKGANKLKEEVGLKVNKLEDEITTLKERLALLREA